MNKAITAVLILLNIGAFILGVCTIIPNIRIKLENKRVQNMAETYQQGTYDTYEQDAYQQDTYEQDAYEQDTYEQDTYEQDFSAEQEVDYEQEEGSVSEMATTQRPSLEDFLWYTESVMYEGVPSDAIDITDFSRLKGSWKSLIVYDPEAQWGASGMSFSNTDISGETEELVLTVDWYMTFWSQEGQSVDESQQDDATFVGKWENDGLWASGPGTLKIIRFYECNDKQYAIGTMDTPDGIPANVALVRP